MALSGEEEAAIIKEISEKFEAVSQIKKHLLDGEGKHEAYRKLEALVNKFGARFSGTQALEDAITHVSDLMKLEGIDVTLEKAQVKHWVRGEENAQLVSPIKVDIKISGLGSSVATPNDSPLEADIVVVRNFEELKNLGTANVSDKIVVYNQEWVKEHKYPIDSYIETVAYRNRGASEAAKLGAVGALIRSVTPFSLGTVHTGWQSYEEGVPKIPAACITIEDAEMLQSMYTNGKNPRVSMFMGAQTFPDKDSFNIVAEIKGTEKVDEIVMIGGHIDSWDICQGAMDDGGAVAISWEVLSILTQLQLKPKRTLRAVFFTGEETNLNGATAYYNAHKNEAANYSIMFESDDGTFTPTGIRFTGSGKAKAILEIIGGTYLKNLKGIDASRVFNSASISDIEDWQSLNVPTGSLSNVYEGERYFWYHHSPADKMSIQDPDDMDLCTVVWAIYAFILADMNDKLPR